MNKQLITYKLLLPVQTTWTTSVEVPKVLLWFWIGNHEDYTLQLHNHRGRLVEKSCNAT